MVSHKALDISDICLLYPVTFRNQCDVSELNSRKDEHKSFKGGGGRNNDIYSEREWMDIIWDDVEPETQFIIANYPETISCSVGNKMLTVNEM